MSKPVYASPGSHDPIQSITAKDLLSTYCVPSTTLGNKIQGENKID